MTQIVWVCLPFQPLTGVKMCFLLVESICELLLVCDSWLVAVMYIIACDHSFQYKISTLMRSTDNFFDVQSSRPSYFGGE